MAAERTRRATHPPAGRGRRTTGARADLAAAGAPRGSAVRVGHGPLDRPARPCRQAGLTPGAVGDTDPSAVSVPQAPAVTTGKAAGAGGHGAGAHSRTGHRVRLSA